MTAQRKSTQRILTQGITTGDGAARTGEIVECVHRLAAAACLTTDQIYRLRLAVDEITTNIVLHGYHGEPGLVELSGGMDADRAWLCIEDEATPFDPASYDPTGRLAEGLTGGREGGFGLFLVLRSVDMLRYEFVDGRNRNTLIMRRPRPDRPGTQISGGFDGCERRADSG